MGTRNRKKRFDNDLNYWQSADFNRRAYAKNFSMLMGLAINRFRWVGLPETCDARFFEWQLHKCGFATMCHKDTLPDVWQTLIASPQGTFDVYGYPNKWRATGYDAGGDNITNYEVTRQNGELCYYSYTRTNPWNAIDIFARKLTHYERTEDVNLAHQQRPYIMIAPQEQKQQLTNLLMQVLGGEPAIIGDNGLQNLVEKITTIETGVPLIAEDLAKAKQNVFYDACLYLGVPHLAFEKGERMIENEVTANTASTNLMLLDCMQARRDFCEKMKRFGLNLEVYFNDDLESYNFNYTNNIEAMAQDKLFEGGQNGMA